MDTVTCIAIKMNVLSIHQQIFKKKIVWFPQNVFFMRFFSLTNLSETLNAESEIFSYHNKCSKSLNFIYFQF